MRPRIRPTALAIALCISALAAVVPGSALAAKHPSPNGRHNISISVTPNPISSGDPLLIWGRLTGANKAGQRVVLWHRIAGRDHFTVVQHGQTDANGFYSFVRPAGVVITNRAWFVRSLRSQSRTVREHVSANVSLDQPPTTADTGTPVSFTGHLAPAGVHRGDRVFLQSDTGATGEGWRNIDAGRVRVDGAYTIVHRFSSAGPRTLRVVFRGDKFNTRDVSDAFDLLVEQKQNPKLTAMADDHSLQEGQSVNISGTLAGPDNGNKTLKLVARSYKQGAQVVASTITDANGNYQFTQTPLRNTAYQVRAADGRPRSAWVYVGVHDVVTVTASATTVQAGTPVTFSGPVSPPKPGHVVYLQKQGTDGNWHIVAQTKVQSDSTYSLTHAFGAPGDKVVRILVPGGPVNQRGVTAPLTITVQPFTPPAS